MLQINNQNIMEVQSTDLWDDILFVILPIAFYLFLILLIFFVIYKFYKVLKKINKQIEEIKLILKDKNQGIK